MIRRMSLLMRKLKLQNRMILFIVFLILLVVIQSAALFYYMMSETVEQQIGKRALHVATTVANIPQIQEAFKKEKPWLIIQPIVEEIRKTTDAEFIVVGNEHGVRYSHPLPSRIGKEMVGGDNARALLRGESYVSKAVGSLGPSLRGKVPIFNEHGKVIGIVSVGFLLEDVEEIIELYGYRILLIALSGLVVGTIGSIYLARDIRKSIFGLEPEEISALYKERNAVIQSVREGIIVVDKRGNISLLNEAAYDILSISRHEVIVGRHVSDVMPQSTILEVLKSGEEQLDRETEFRGKKVIVNRLPVIEGDQVIGVVSSFRLKSEIDGLMEELTQSQKYTEALRAQTHEFNNLLYTISGLIQLQAYDEVVELIRKEAITHQDFINFIIKKVDDHRLAGILVGFYNRSRELKVQFMIDPDSALQQIPAHIEINHLVSILGNMITNGFEAVLQNKEKEKVVKLFFTDIGDDLIIEIEDTGPGIDDSLFPHIFKKGYSTKQGEDRGFGLARVKELVNELNGEISLEKGDLGGALFIVAIPKERSR
jgi:two-component system CitB family sensor kinase